MSTPIRDHTERAVFIRNDPNNKEERKSDPESRDQVTGCDENHREKDRYTGPGRLKKRLLFLRQLQRQVATAKIEKQHQHADQVWIRI